MPLVRLTQGPARSIADFPDGVARSTEGALHLVPGVVREVTEDEATHLKARHAHLPVTFIEGTARRRPPAAKTAKAASLTRPDSKAPASSEPIPDKGKEV